jgi:hypothetical protein
MNPEIKARWTAALHSGEYGQAHNALRTDEGYCCLGVLCDLAVKDEVIDEAVKANMFDNDYAYNGTTSLLPQEVVAWAGLTGSNPRVNADSLPEGAVFETGLGTEGGIPTLANLNDGGTPFTVIADIIDAQL